MNSIDIVVIILLAVAFIAGFRRGLVRELASLVGVWLAIWVSVKFSDKATVWLNNHISFSETLVKYVSFLLLFVLILFGVRYLARMLSSAVNLTPLGAFNSLGGAVFSATKMCLFIGLIVWALEEWKLGLVAEKDQTQSVVYPILKKGVETLIPFAKTHFKTAAELWEKEI